MPLTREQLRELPSPFYRVAAKVLIFDDQNRLLFVMHNVHGELNAELPGGGWEHREGLQECLQREFLEEIGVEATQISPVLFTFACQTIHGWHRLCVVTRAELQSHDFVCGDEMVEARFVARKDLHTLPFIDPADAIVCDYAEQIWEHAPKK